MYLAIAAATEEFMDVLVDDKAVSAGDLTLQGFEGFGVKLDYLAAQLAYQVIVVFPFESDLVVVLVSA